MKRRDFLNSSLLAAAVYMPGLRTAYAVVGTDKVADVVAVTGDGREISLRGAEIRDLAAKMRGRLLVAGDDGYDQARLILNPSFDKRPALIAQPTGAADVQAAVNFAREHQLLTAVKCGGHSHSGQSTCDRGLQIDLSAFRGVRVDPKARRAWVDGGTLLGQVDYECMAHGLVAPLGTVSHTGVGGLTLGGGFGRLARKFGMAIDNLESLDVVTADGQLRHASATENPELFWGLRGGGGNFGVVTNFEFRLHPMQRQVIAGTLAFPIARARDVLGMFGEYAATAPDELYMDPVMMVPAGRRTRDHYAGNLLQRPARGRRACARTAAQARQARQRLHQGHRLRRGATLERHRGLAFHRSYLKGGFIPRIPDKLVSSMVDGFEGNPGAVYVAVLPALRRRLRAPARSRHRVRAAECACQHDDGDRLAPGCRRSCPAHRGHAALLVDARTLYARLLRQRPATRGHRQRDQRQLSRQLLRGWLRSRRTHDPTNLFRLNANVQPPKS